MPGQTVSFTRPKPSLALCSSRYLIKQTGRQLALCTHIYMLYLCVRSLGSSLVVGAGMTQGLHWLTHQISRLLGVEHTSLVQADSPKAGGQMISASHEICCIVMILELHLECKTCWPPVSTVPHPVPLTVVMVQIGAMETSRFFIDSFCHIGKGQKRGGCCSLSSFFD